MENLTRFNLNRRRWAVQLALTTALALLFTVALLWGLRAVNPARADPGDLYVDGASGHDMPTCGTTIAPCQTISYTLNSRASDGDTILIAAGTYTENLTITGIAVTLRGGYTISGTLWLTGTGETVINGNDADRVFLIHDSNSVLEDLTITGGVAPPAECWGGGVWITNGNATIRSSAITGNGAGCGSGGISVNDDWGPAHLTLESSTISHNTGGGFGGLGLSGGGASVEVREVTFAGNTAADSGGGICVDFGSAVIADTHVFSNTAGNVGGGIAVRDGASVVISDSQIYSNTAEEGGGIGVSEAILSMSNSSVMDNSAPYGQSGGIHVGKGSTVNVVDSTISDNSTRDHGGAAATVPGASLNLTNTLITGNWTTSGNASVLGVNSDVTIMNSTISDNDPQAAQAILLWSGHLTITNSIMWNNALNLQSGEPPCLHCFTVTYSDIQGGWTGTGNIDTDPLFVGGGDYHLQMGSPCIDAGTNTGAPDHDLDQRHRPQDGDGDGTATADMGAYEFRLYRIYLPLALTNSGP
jgi:hypothetical protein